jgi:predicted nucleic acid-binding protein
VCLIVDANVAFQFLGEPGPVINWLFGVAGEPRLVASGKLREELARHNAVRRLLVRLEQAGRLRSCKSADVLESELRLRGAGHCLSNDHHILALAIVSGARTLATLDDDLTKDFKSRKIISGPRGSVYRDPDAHGHLLRHTGSCGVRVIRPRRGKEE